MPGQQYPTARESPREFSRASGAMINAQNMLRMVADIAARVTQEPSHTIIMLHDLSIMQDMLDETVSCQTQTLALLEKIKHKLSDH